VYLDGGEARARAVILGLLADRVATAAAIPGSDDPKTTLQELALERGIGLPRYRVEGEGPDHEKVFTAVVLLEGVERGLGTGVSKKAAEQAAAREAAASLRAADVADPGTDARTP
jgi:ribonuclease-3